MAARDILEVAATSVLWKPLGIIKHLPFIGLLGAAAVTLPFIASGLRSNRRFDEDSVPLPKYLADPLPPVLEYTPPAPAPLVSMENPVEGAFAQKIKMQRAGASAGPDVTPPNILTPAGVSMIDGKHVQDLNSEAATSGFNLSA